jgi:hypothetical protein
LRAIIFRQQFTQMTDIVDKTLRLYNVQLVLKQWLWSFFAQAALTAGGRGNSL